MKREIKIAAGLDEVIESRQTCGIDASDAPEGEAQTSASWRLRDSLLFIVASALAIRLIAAPFVQPWHVGPESSLWKTGPEIVNIAQSLASHQGFSSPFGVATGPTAWIPPLYPYLLSLVFTVFGIKTGSAAVFILIMQAFFSALVCIPTYQIGCQVFGRRIGASAAWAWALFPYAVLLPVLFVWETALSALLLTILCYGSMRLASLPLGPRTGIGVLWGVAALTNTALLVLLPVFLAAQLWAPFQRSRWLRAWVPVLLAGLLTVAPWSWRNWRVFHTVMPIRSNFAENLWLGNHQGGAGRIVYGLNASENQQELQKYASMGEIQYLAARRREAMQFISRRPLEFAHVILYRIQYWWYAKGESAPIFTLYILLSALSACGMVLAFIQRIPGARFVATCILFYPVAYYLTDVYARYRYPIEPLMTLLATSFVIEALDRSRKWSARRNQRK